MTLLFSKRVMSLQKIYELHDCKKGKYDTILR